MNYYETMGEHGNMVPTTISHLDTEMNGALADVLGQDPALARGFLNAPVDPQVEAEHKVLSWIASMAELGLLTPDQLIVANQNPGFSVIRAAVNVEGLQY